MTTTPERKTPEQIIEEVLSEFPERVWLSHRIADRLRAAGLLGGDPNEDAVERGARAFYAASWLDRDAGLSDTRSAAEMVKDGVRAALAAAPVVDEAKLAEVIQNAEDGDLCKNGWSRKPGPGQRRAAHAVREHLDGLRGGGR